MHVGHLEAALERLLPIRQSGELFDWHGKVFDIGGDPEPGLRCAMQHPQRLPGLIGANRQHLIVHLHPGSQNVDASSDPGQACCVLRAALVDFDSYIPPHVLFRQAGRSSHYKRVKVADA